MGLFDRFWKVPLSETPAPEPRREAGTPRPDDPKAAGLGYTTDPLADRDRANGTTLIALALRAAQQRDRPARYRDFEAMDNGDIAAMLDAVVNAALTFEDVASGRGFKMECDEPRTEEILQAAIDTADLLQHAEEALRDMLKYGDCYGEPVFFGKQLLTVQPYAPGEMFVTRDDKGRLSGAKDDAGLPVAFQQRRGGKTLAGWQPWEICHGRLFPSRRLTYSAKSLLDDIRLDWRKLQLVELGMVTARVTRAYPRRVHTLDVTGKTRPEQEQSLLRYITRVTGKGAGKRQLNEDGLPSVDVQEDLYLTTGYTLGDDGKQYPMLNNVRVEDPAIAGLAQMEDVEYLRRKIWSIVPADVVGISRNTSGDLDSQDVAYARLLRKVQYRLEVYLRSILDAVLLANGILPSRVEYRLRFNAVSTGAAWKHSDARFRDSLTVRNYMEMGGVSRRFAIKRAFNISDREFDEMLREIEEEANNPVFQLMIAPARNGAPGGDLNGNGAEDPGGQVTGKVQKALPGSGGPAAPTAGGAPVIGATGADPTKASTTRNGISRGTKLGKRLAGSRSGG